MTLRRRMFVTVGGILIAMLALAALGASGVLSDLFRDLERQRAQDALVRVLNGASRELAALQALADDWSRRGETLAFVREGAARSSEPGRFREALGGGTADLFALLDPSGRILHETVLDPEAGKLASVPSALDSLLREIGRPAQRADSFGESRSGVCLARGEPYCLAMSPIPAGQGAGPSPGHAVVGRRLRTDSLADPGDQVRLWIRPVSPAEIEGRRPSTADRWERGDNPAPAGPSSSPREFPGGRDGRIGQIEVRRGDRGVLVAEGPLPGFFDQTRLLAQAELPGRIHGAGVRAMRAVGLAILASGLLGGLAILFFLERGVFRRLDRLRRELDAMPRAGRPPGGLGVDAEDEIGSIAAGLNRILDELSRAGLERVEALAKMEEARREAETLAQARARFLADMSHEIRTPMGAILGMSGLLLDSELKPDQREQLEMIHRSADGLLQVLNDVLDLAKIEQGRMILEEIDLRPREIMEDVGGLLAYPAAGKGLELVVYVDPDVPAVVQGDPGRLRQILSNLIVNAIKFTEAGEIVLRASVARRDGAKKLVLSVRDTGVGIAPDRLEAIFEEFTQEEASTARRFGGTGLGLTISRHLASLMGGTLTATSRVGEGSCFCLEIPLLAAETTPERPPERVAPYLPVLLACASEATRQAVGSLLEEQGCWVHACGGAADARAFWRSPAAGQVRAIFLDRKLPDEDGLALAAALLRERSGRAPAAFLLCRPGEAPRESEAQAAGVAGTIGKPVTAARLRAALESLPAEVTRPIAASVAGSPGPAVAAVREAGPEGEEEIGPPDPDLRGYACRVLLVDDHEVSRRISMRRLAMTGVSAEEASGGEEAIRICSQEAFDLVFIDLAMTGLDAFQTAAALRGLETGRGAALPIVGLSAEITEEEAERCRAAGLNDHLPKPVRPEDLIRVIRRWVAATREGAVDPAGSPSPLDLSRLEEISGGDEGFEQELMEEFLANVPRLVEQVGRAARSGDGGAGVRAAHTLKGSAAMVGAGPLAETARELEDAFARGDRESAEVLARETGRRLEELREFATRHFRGKAA